MTVIAKTADAASASTRHRLDGLEPDNPLAFLALLGLLRALEANDRVHPSGAARLAARIAWDLDCPPVRPLLFLSGLETRTSIAEAASRGLAILATHHDFEGRQDLNYTRSEARKLLLAAASEAAADKRGRADALAALMSDVATKGDKGGEDAAIDPTPLCLLFGQGHQHFLDRFCEVPTRSEPPPRGRGKGAVTVSASQCIAEALFSPWHRSDPTFSFRWDPDEDVRYALMAGDPTDTAYKPGTQHGANRLAAVGLTALTVVPESRGRRIRAAVLGGRTSPDGFSLAWPIWRDPATLSAIRALLGHPDLRTPGALGHLSVDHVRMARRIAVGKFMNFTRAQVIEPPL